MSGGSQRVMVAVRVRPMLREGSHLQTQEKFELQGVYRTGDTSLKVELTKPGEPAKCSTFTFDHIFDQESTQLEVYEDSVVDMVDAALVGINASLLAYGQTGSGKTFSVLGDVKPNPLENDLLTTNSGMFLRVLSDLMDYKMRQAKKGWHVVVGLSCMEIYNDNIRDLFGGKPNTPPPPLKAVMIGDDVMLPSLIVKEMTSLQGVFSEIQLAIARRKSRSTEANSQSSRSHCLFSIDILQQANTAPPPSLDILDISRKGDDRSAARRSSVMPASPTTTKSAHNTDSLPPHEMPFQGSVYRIPGQKEPIYTSKIILADLAGSERISKSGVTGDGLVEATFINSSLTALGNVVHSLHEGSYVSYRTSNLTRLLKPTFSQQASRVLLLAQCSPTQLTFDETISTLHFANKVKAMKVTTTTGAEAEKLQFEFLEQEKVYDALLADLHVFAVDTGAQPGIMRRKLGQHQGLFYDAEASKAAAKSKPNLKERRAHIDSTGATALAEKERDAITQRRDKEIAEESQRQKQAITEVCDELVRAHKAKTDDIKESISKVTTEVLQHITMRLQIESAAKGNQVVAEEEAAWATLTAKYTQEHVKMCQVELNKKSAALENVSRELVKQHLTTASAAIPEVVEDDKQYALATWQHCVSKRFFSSCMELREELMCILSVSEGNKKLERWAKENAEVLKNFEAGQA